MSTKVPWQGVFPSVSTQFRDDYRLDIDATAYVIDGLLRDGASGLVECGTVGENTSPARDEKLQPIEAAARIGVDGIMLTAALAYSAKPHESAAHFRAAARATDVPPIVYTASRRATRTTSRPTSLSNWPIARPSSVSRTARAARAEAPTGLAGRSRRRPAALSTALATLAGRL